MKRGSLTFYFGTMNAGKSAMLLQTHHQLKDFKRVLLVTTMVTENQITSRTGLKADCMYIDHVITYKHFKAADVILIDEAQFMSESQVAFLRHIADNYPVEIICYGLRSNTNGHIFNGTKALFVLSDEIKQLKSYCQICGNPALLHNSVEGQTGKAAFQSVCSLHFEGDLL